MEPQNITFTLSEDCYQGAKSILDEHLLAKTDDPLAVASVNFPAENPRMRLQVDRKLKGDVWNLSAGGRSHEVANLMDFKFPEGDLPDDIVKLVNMSYQEAINCYSITCFLAAIALCGRTIETVLGAVYQRLTGVHPSVASGKPGFNAIVNELKRRGFQTPTGLKEKMELIAQHRNMAIHGNLVIPTDDEARSVIYATRDVLRYTVEGI